MSATGEDREALFKALAGIVEEGIDHRDAVDAVLRAGFRRSVVSTREDEVLDDVVSRTRFRALRGEPPYPDDLETLVAAAYAAVSAPPTITDAGDVISIPRPVVPFGPAGVSEDKATAQYLREVIHKIEGGYATVGGSNVTRTVMSLLASTATVLENRALGGEEKTQ